MDDLQSKSSVTGRIDDREAKRLLIARRVSKGFFDHEQSLP
jgi:hypothetical protein